MDELIIFGRYTFLFLVFILGALYWSMLGSNTVSSCESNGGDMMSILLSIAAITGTILSISITLTPQFLGQMHQKYRDDEIPHTFRREWSYKWSKRLSISLLISSILGSWALSKHLFPIDVVLTPIILLFVITIVSFTFFIQRVERYALATDKTLLEILQRQIMDDLRQP